MISQAEHNENITQLLLNDPDLIAEAKGYTIGDLMDKEVDARLTTRHFDLLIACAIAYQTNKFIKKPEKIKPNRDLDYRLSGQAKIVNPAI